MWMIVAKIFSGCVVMMDGWLRGAEDDERFLMLNAVKPDIGPHNDCLMQFWTAIRVN
jgi:hypothetical protein